MLSSALTACYKSPENNLKSSEIIGEYRGYEVSFIRDNAWNDSKGFYYFNKKSNTNNISSDFKEKISGFQDGKELIFVDDSSMSSSGKGFYVLKDGDNYTPVATYAQKYPGHKTTITYAVGALKSSSLDDLSLDEIQKLKTDLEDKLNQINSVYLIKKQRR